MFEREGNYMSLDPDIAMRGVRADMGRKELIEVAYNARCGAARRLALVRLNDPGFSAAFAKSDPDPMVRRRMVRTLSDRSLLEHILDVDNDDSVRKATQERLDEIDESQE